MIQQPNLDPQPEEDLEELLDLAAELAPPEKLASAWDRRARYAGGDRFAHMMRFVAMRNDEDDPEYPNVDDREAARVQRERIRAVISELGDLSPTVQDEAERPTRALIQVSSRQAGWRWVDGFKPAAAGRWRKPAGIAGGVAAAAVVAAIGWHTWGPNVGQVAYTQTPTVGSSSSNTSSNAPYQPQAVYTPSYGSSTTAPTNNPLVIPVTGPATTTPKKTGGSTSSPQNQVVEPPVQIVPTIPTASPTPPPSTGTILPPPPTANPTPAPTAAPTPAPTPTPTAAPTPTPAPTATPTPAPTATPAPTPTPTPAPTATPDPTANPTPQPTP